MNQANGFSWTFPLYLRDGDSVEYFFTYCLQSVDCDTETFRIIYEAPSPAAYNIAPSYQPYQSYQTYQAPAASETLVTAPTSWGALPPAMTPPQNAFRVPVYTTYVPQSYAMMPLPLPPSWNVGNDVVNNGASIQQAFVQGISAQYQQPQAYVQGASWGPQSKGFQG
eukprot:gb/GEZN01015803.1/.p1 GENE.gb/GEZN01015803.1/~~gb/GEZN01015803.1/.p1  ORF type:complete len:167 (-),score=5.52 gb/GEZN01015803.1/:255-755(-)